MALHDTFRMAIFEEFLDALEPIYAAASPVGLDVVLGECRTGQDKALMPAKPQPRKKS